MEQDMILYETPLLDELEEIIHVSNIRDYSLLHLSRAGRLLTDLRQEDVRNNKYHCVLQDRDTPRPFCTNAKLSEDGFCVWEYENPHLNKNFIIEDRPVEREGRPARMKVAMDVGDRVKERGNHTSKCHMETVMLETLRVLDTTDYLDDAINRTLKMIADFYGGERTYIVEIDRIQGFARNTYEWYRAGIPSQKAALQRVPLDGISYLFETFNKKQHLIVSRTGELRDSYPSEYRYLTARSVDNLFAMPLEDESAFSGYVGTDNPSINRDTIKLLDSIAYNITNKIKKRRLYERLEYEAAHDSLSGLLSGESFVHFRNDLIRSGKMVSYGVVVGDINGLKQLNHDYGQSRGDMIIKEAVSVMASSFTGASIFRLSGDKFIIVSLESVYEEFMGRAGKIEWMLDSRTPNGVSLGYTWEEHLADFDRLIRHAEELVLMNKQIYYKDGSQERRHYSPEYLNRLLQDIEEDCYCLCLQPKCNSLTGKVCPAEALMRYRAAGTESTQPLNFVPLLEKTELMRYLDFCMLEQVFKLLSDWKERGRELIPVSASLSRVTLLGRDLFQILTDMQKGYYIPVHLVMVEITESIGDIERKVIESIGSKLRGAGFRISLDDFGANYANMSILSIMQFDRVKLGRSLMNDLVKNQTNQTVVKCIIGVCRSLQVEYATEGAENQEQLELLTPFGCTAVQGYYYSRPLEIAEFGRI